MEKVIFEKNGYQLFRDESDEKHKRLIMRKDGKFIKVVSSVFAVNEMSELFPTLQ